MYRCNACDYIQNKFFGVCPVCKEGVGEETNDTPTTASSYKPQYKRVDPFAKELTISRATQYVNFNALLSSGKGFIDGQVILLGAAPGVGKSTLCISIADEDTLYISSEENYSQVNQRALRVNPKCNCNILNSTKFEEIMEAIETCKEKLIIIDSLNSIDFGVGYITVAKFASKITNAIKNRGKIGIIISQVAKNGEISGMNSIIHIVDTVLYIERSEVSSNIIATSSKNRYGEIGGVAVFTHLKDGFTEIDIDHMNIKSEVGATYTETRFGHKNMTIAIESLVASAQSSYGMKRSNGYNQNRLIQVIGILSYFSKIDFNAKDVYIAISNGLCTDDISIELAMANSILSSLYNKAIIKKATGEIRLNGKINNGMIDEQPITHISDLIALYKK